MLLSDANRINFFSLFLKPFPSFEEAYIYKFCDYNSFVMQGLFQKGEMIQ